MQFLKLVDNTGKLVKEGLTSDKAGKVNVTGLAPGDYSFIETQAPTGYILNTIPTPFTILAESEGQPQTGCRFQITLLIIKDQLS